MLTNEIPVPDLQKTTETEKEKTGAQVDADPEDSLYWKEEWFENYVADEEAASRKSFRRPLFVYTLIAFLCLVVLGSWVGSCIHRAL